jgi:hypothetical protein
MKRAIVMGLILFISLIVLLNISLNSLEGEYDKHKDQLKQNIGLKVLLNKDTLQIIDYSTIEGNYTLSNGVKVVFELIEQIKIK